MDVSPTLVPIIGLAIVGTTIVIVALIIAGLSIFHRYMDVATLTTALNDNWPLEDRKELSDAIRKVELTATKLRKEHTS
jgi:hypothetical protein